MGIARHVTVQNQNDRETDREVVQERICLLVLGMHRSGTSALTRLLSLAGARLPDTLLGASDSNPTGHWESELLMQLHDGLLEELGSRWSDWRALPVGRLTPERRTEIKTELRDILAIECEEAPLFVVKDPRICRFAQLYIEALSDAGVAVRAVLPVRNPIEVCASLERRSAMNRADAALLWLRHVVEAERATRSLRRAFVSYGSVLGDWKSCLAHIGDRLGLVWPHAADQIAAQVNEFLCTGLRHYEHSLEEIRLDPSFGDWIGDAYDALLALERDPNDSRAMDSLDAVGDAFIGTAPMLYQLLAEVRREQEQPQNARGSAK